MAASEEVTLPGGPGPAVSLESIRAAQLRIRDAIRLTPVWQSLTLEAIAGVPVSFKCEHLQRAGSFKVRGAANFVMQLPLDGAVRGLVAASAGNHAQGVALAATTRGIRATVVMPASAPLAKAAAARGYGATVVLHGNSLAEARDRALAIAAEQQLVFVPPFDSDAVIAGQGTVGLEILAQQPDVEEILVPAGGGGLLAGVACAVKGVAPHVKVVGVQAAAMDGIVASRAAGRAVTVEPSRTIADGVAVAGPSGRTFALIEKYVDDVVACSDDAIARAIVLLIERSKFIVEGAGVLGAAAIQSGAYRPRGRTVCVLSGGNIDINLLGSIVRRGLADAGRYQQLVLEVSDTPGELALVAQVVADAGGNIVDVDHNREAPGMPIGVAVLELLLEVNSRDHFEAIVRALREAGLRGVPGSAARLATESARRRHGR